MLFVIIISFCSSYQSFSDKIRTQIFSGRPGEVLEIFAPNNPFLATISYLDSSKTLVEVASPLQSAPIDIKSNRTFFFPKGKSKFKIKFKEQSNIIFNYASIPEGICSDGISVIINETYELLINSQSNLDKCYFFAYPSTEHRFKVIKNELETDATLCAYSDSMSGSPYQCYQKGNPIDPSFIPNDGSLSPWIFRFIAKTNYHDKANIIKILLQAPPIYSNPIGFSSFIGAPTKYDEPIIGKYHKKWWIPILGSIAPTFLLIAWIYTFLHLIKKRNASVVYI